MNKSKIIQLEKTDTKQSILKKKISNLIKIYIFTAISKVQYLNDLLQLMINLHFIIGV